MTTNAYTTALWLTRLHDPSPPVPPQFAPILMGGPCMVTAGGDNRVDAAPGQTRPQGMAVIASIGHQPVGPLARASRLAGASDRDRVERPLEERDRRRGRRVQGLLPAEVPAPSTSTIHFVPFPRFVLPTLDPPCWRARSCHPHSLHLSMVDYSTQSNQSI
jgi:hypothetical protein